MGTIWRKLAYVQAMTIDVASTLSIAKYGGDDDNDDDDDDDGYGHLASYQDGPNEPLDRQSLYFKQFVGPPSPTTHLG